MDEGGSRVLIEGGVLRIWDRQHCLLTRVQRIENCMYRLELQVARPLCLAVHRDDDAWRWHERLRPCKFWLAGEDGQVGDGAWAVVDQPRRAIL
jgi:hypothetical protein